MSRIFGWCVVVLGWFLVPGGLFLSKNKAAFVVGVRWLLLRVCIMLPWLSLTEGSAVGLACAVGRSLGSPWGRKFEKVLLLVQGLWGNRHKAYVNQGVTKRIAFDMAA